MGKGSTRKLLKEYGSRGRLVRVFVETFADRNRQELVRVEWRERDDFNRLVRKTTSLPNDRKNQATAKSFAEGVADRLKLHGPEKRERITMLTLGERYVLAHPVPETWRPKTLKTFLGRWKVWLAFARPTRMIDTVTPELLDELRAALKAQDYAINQVANIVQMVKSVYRFARARKYLLENPIADYRMRLSRDQRRLEVPEWTPEECAKILAQLDPHSPRHWRAYTAIVLDALLGGRSNALLNLEWDDIDLKARTIRWRPELDKLAKDRVQPLPRDAVRALRIAKTWRLRLGYTGKYVIPGDMQRMKKAVSDRPFTYQALNQALRNASVRAKVLWVEYRAMHGFRRMVLNTVLSRTGNLTRAGQFIGDTDMRTLVRSYVRQRPEELRDVAEAMTLPTLPPPIEGTVSSSRKRRKKSRPKPNTAEVVT